MKARALATAAVIIVGVVVAIEGERIALSRARYSRTRAEIAELRLALRRYYVDHGSYPTTDEGVAGLADLYLKGGEDDPGIVHGLAVHAQPPRDAWGNRYFYQSDGRSYLLESFGPDGVEGGSAALVVRSPLTPPD